MRRFLRQFDVILFLAPFVILAASVSVLFSLVQHNVVSDHLLWIKQLSFGLFGLALATGLSFIDYRFIRPFTGWLYAGLLLLLFLVLETQRISGSARWFNFGFFQFQPSEFMKLAIILLLAHLFADRIGRLPLHLLLGALAIIGLPIMLVLLQPDLGTAIVLTASSLAILWTLRLTSLQRLVFITTLVLVFSVGTLAVLGIRPFNSLLKPYQRARVEVFLNPKSDPLGKGYNVTQSLIAVSSGGLSGRGLIKSETSYLNLVPAPATDFIFTSFAESFGYIGIFVLFVAEFVFLIRIIAVASESQDEFGMFIAIGIFAMFIVQIFINTGMTIGVTPVTGIPLPFMTYGGSHLMKDSIALGILQSIVIRKKRLDFQG